MGVHEKLMHIQTELKAPKSQFNNFGKYHYRNLEDILEALKPLLKKHKAIVNVTDEIEFIGERYYVKATATLTDLEELGSLSSTAYAREEESKKGMDASQLTGSTSSYARKYALNGLFAIDDTKDSDTTNKHENDGNKAKSDTVTVQMLHAVLKENGVSVERVLDKYRKDTGKTVSELQFLPQDYKRKVYEGFTRQG